MHDWQKSCSYVQYSSAILNQRSYCSIEASATSVMAFCCCWSVKKSTVYGTKENCLKTENSHLSLRRLASESHKPTPHENPQITSLSSRFDRTESSSAYYTPFTSLCAVEALRAQGHTDLHHSLTTRKERPEQGRMNSELTKRVKNLGIRNESMEDWFND